MLQPPERQNILNGLGVIPSVPTVFSPRLFLSQDALPILTMSFPNNLLTILNDPATIHFVPGTDRADFGEIDLTRNPQRTSQGFVWFMPNRATEASVTFVGKVAYNIIGDKSGAYFSLPGDEWVRSVFSL